MALCIDFIVEEPSMEALLRIILPKIMGETAFNIYTHQGKSDLINKLPKRLKGYSSWIPEGHKIIVLVDRDNDDCKVLKKQLDDIARDSGLTLRSNSGVHFCVLNRIAIEELEAWYFGDWKAVVKAYPKVSAKASNKARFRDPDAIKGGTWEAFEKVLKYYGYFETGLRKIEAARAIAPHMTFTDNTSSSFQSFYSGINELLASQI